MRYRKKGGFIRNEVQKFCKSPDILPGLSRFSGRSPEIYDYASLREILTFEISTVSKAGTCLELLACTGAGRPVHLSHGRRTSPVITSFF